MTMLLYFMHLSQKTIMMLLAIMVISERAAFNPHRYDIKNSLLSFTVIVFSNIIGGVSSFYWPFFNKILTVIYATSSFYLTNTRSKFTIFMLGNVMFIVASASAYDLHMGLKIMELSLVIAFCFQIYNWFFIDSVRKNNGNKNTAHGVAKAEMLDNRNFRACIVCCVGLYALFMDKRLRCFSF